MYRYLDCLLVIMCVVLAIVLLWPNNYHPCVVNNSGAEIHIHNCAEPNKIISSIQSHLGTGLSFHLKVLINIVN
ncbi:8 kda polypeptide [Potato aucuba mosaic virus]|uniref:Movement protein TGBp3 n=1 Tax=Potato aucuba mosaic virus TaxID=12182 RepID=Q86824_PAMV|nr:8 kDa protein [Potato aucuba mosaic virus]AAB32334.1 8 kda polypeptide [Potato aucuba mosaic virus]prf//2012194E 8K protein [Potato aucuba mosaic virus]